MNIPLKIGRATGQIVILVTIIKVLVLAFGTHAYLLFSNQQLPASNLLFGIWNRWDAQSYISIALHGYIATGERRFNIAFFPVYPFLVSAFTIITGDPVLGGILVSGIASIILAVFFHKLVKLDYPEKTANAAVWFLFIYPTSYFLHIPYTESVFLALVVGCFYCFRIKKWMLAGILGCLACATRVNGLILCVALPFELLVNWREYKRVEYKWLWLGLIPLGFVAYLFLNYFVMGDPLAFLQIQREHWYKYLANPFTAIWGRMSGVISETKPTQKMEGLFEIIFIAIGLIGTVFGWRHLRNSYRVWMVASWFLFVSTSFILSVPRYTLTMFPLFIVIALVAKNRIRFALITSCSILYLGLFITSFVQGRWAF